MSSSLFNCFSLLLVLGVLLQSVPLTRGFEIPENTVENCDIVSNEAIHVVMDRVCDMCHEIFSHNEPNLRAECRADCFGTPIFKRCLNSFTKQQKRYARHLRHTHHRH